MNVAAPRFPARKFGTAFAAITLAVGAAAASAESDAQPKPEPSAADRFKSVVASPDRMPANADTENADTARCPRPNSRLFALRDATAAVENTEHFDLVKDGTEVIAQHYPIFITPYSKHTEGGGAYYTPDLWALGVPFPFFAVFPGKVESIIDANGKEVPRDIVDSLHTFVTPMDGDHDNIKSTAYALRVPLPNGMWRIKEVRGYVYAIIGVNSEWTDLGRIPFKTGGKSLSKAKFEFTDVTPFPNDMGATFHAVTDPKDVITAAQVSFGVEDDTSKIKARAGGGGWNPTPDPSAQPEKKFGPINGTYHKPFPGPLPPDARVRVRLVTNGRLVKIPFVFSNGNDVVIPTDTRKAAAPDAPVQVSYGPHATGFAFRADVYEYRVPPPPVIKPLVIPDTPPKKAPPATPAPASPAVAPPVEPPLPFWHAALGKAFATMVVGGKLIVPPGERAMARVPPASLNGGPGTAPGAAPAAKPISAPTDAPVAGTSPPATPKTSEPPVTTAAPLGGLAPPQAPAPDPQPVVSHVDETATGDYRIDEEFDPTMDAEAGRGAAK